MNHSLFCLTSKPECSTFIDALFTVIRTKSYLPYTASSPPPTYPSLNHPELDVGIPIPLDGLVSPSIPPPSDRTRKRSIGDDEPDLRPPAKGPRISSDSQFSRFHNGGSRSMGRWEAGHADRQDINGHGAMNDINGSYAMAPISERQPRNYRPPDPKRGICRDYHSAVSPFDSRHGVLISLLPDSGYCARGAFCKYSHGDDAVVPSQIFPMPGVPMPAAMSFMSMFPTAGLPFPLGMAPGAAYDPHEAQMDMRPQSLSSGSRPHNRAPLLPRMQGEDSTQVTETTRAPGELPVIQDLTPNPLLSSTPVPNEASESFSSASDVATGSGSVVPVQVQPLRTIPGPMGLDTAAGMLVAQSGRFQNFGRGRGRGHFTGEAHNFHGERRNDKTLVVEKIPEDKLSLDAVNAWFKRFGTVTNVAVDAANAKALVSFLKHEEAYAAWKSEDAVFNNRFVKIFWHRPMEGHGQVGARMLASSAPLVASMTAKESNLHSTLIPSTLPAQSAPPPAPPTPQMQKPSIPSTSVSALATKQRLLEQQIAEQRSLMAKLSTATPVEKKQIMARLRNLGEEMTPSAATTPATPSLTPVPAATLPDDEHQQQKDRLDRELEMHNAASAVGVESGNSTEDLKAKLEKLKAEVC